MCIIVSKPRNVKFPTMETLRNCWDSNPDGAGFMYVRQGKVYIRKGLMSWADFEIALGELSNTIDLDKEPVVMHFRISTQGGVNPQNTHPFPISGNTSKLTQLSTSSKIGGIVHNGIISWCSNYLKDEKHSDTYYFVRDYVSKLVTKYSELTEIWMQDVLLELSNSKLTFLLPTGEIVLVGDFIEKDGVAYSNTGYVKSSYNYLNDYEVYRDEYGGYNNYYYLDKPKKQSTSHVKDNGLTYCKDGMFYLDEDTGDMYDCEACWDMYDEEGELWQYDEEECDYYRTGYFVYNENMCLASYVLDEIA